MNRHVSSNPARRKRVAVIGGMGPLASAEFVKTIYESCLSDLPEQLLPNVVLLSDPSVPDRTAAFRALNQVSVVERLDELIDEARSLGADVAVICCFTAHYVVERLKAANRAILVSLVDLALQEVARRQGGLYLLAGSQGSMDLEVFQRSAYWSRAAEYVKIPDSAQQRAIHACIYEIKQSGATDGVLESIRAIVRDAGCDGIVCGCTELHYVSRDARELLCVDPLQQFADALISDDCIVRLERQATAGPPPCQLLPTPL